MLTKNGRRSGEMNVRVHQFPPLRQNRQNRQSEGELAMDPVEYQNS